MKSGAQNDVNRGAKSGGLDSGENLESSAILDSATLDSRATNSGAIQRTKLKMCGLWREEDIIIANELRPDFIGFVFAKSPRQVSIESARALKSKLDKNIKAVGVFVVQNDDMQNNDELGNDALAQIAQIAQEGIIDIIQLHDTRASKATREARIHALRKLTSAPIIKAISVRDSQSLLDEMDSSAQCLLLDNAHGGSGERFSWEHITQARQNGFNRAFFLAGGINAQNLKEALKLAPFGIDLSKGLETEGKKDAEKMRQIARIMQEYATNNAPKA
ncbi:MULTISPECIES: phosphoribosylanthranilate isomerase [unclassified Helicobacter]|uniref:phosphoribosylanthranilate isomerase n=1 Tax=unclassified Helicobacter TaxID=2593540 RepID=UPI0009ED0F96|nr:MULTISPECIES: phosphoribosylanthranilate isomerase [unclassified Helicobacter]